VNRDEYGRLKEIVADALAVPADGRTAFVADRCGTDTHLRIEVESLLAAAVNAAALYENPALLIRGAHGGDILHDVQPAEPRFEGTARYRVRRRIGGGGMGIVYEVDDLMRGQPIALKTLRRLDSDAIYQLKREFRNLADVAHPNLVALYDLVIDDNQCFFTMELVDGAHFVDYIRDSEPHSGASDRIRSALPQLVEGLEELHRCGMRHGDIKPSNVLVTAEGRVVILDFGLTSTRRGDVLGNRRLAGSPAYVSPEQCLGQPASSASDWYAVGATLYHALAGQAPFDGSVRAVIHRKTTEDPLPVSLLAPDVSHDLSEVCMGLLRRDPARRIAGRDVVRRLRATSVDDSSEAADAVFIGRQPALDALRAVFADVAQGRSASVVVHGPSGIGKSALVQHFIAQHQEHALVLRSRCHQHESIPYKGLDGIVDGIARHLTELPHEARSALLPDDAGALASLFPVIRALGMDAPSDRVSLDLIELRRQAFVAFRGLLGRLGAHQPVILDIDDFHWADADSVLWVTEILRPPAPSSLLTIISFRSEELDAKPFLRSLIERVDIGERLTLPLEALTDHEVTQLVGALLPPNRQPDRSTMAGIVRDSSGNPFLVDALTRHLVSGARAGDATLGEMLTRRLESLPRQSRPFLETLALCGRAVLPARVFEACGFTGDERPLVARLRAAHLVRNSRSPDLIEMYHDRIRETLAGRVSPDAARRMHALMAQVLVAHGDDEPEALFEHYKEAGDPTLAAEQAARAAVKASSVLAFDLAVTFYGHALRLHPDGAQQAAWTVGLARALENAGRPIESADAYLRAAALATAGQQLEWRRKAAELLLIGGEIDRGLAVSSDVLHDVGLRLARGPRSAIASLLCRRLQLRLRGLEFTAKAESEIPPGELLRIDAGWAISSGLAMVDPIRAAAFNVRQLLRALEVGDPYRVARAMALEAGFSVVGAGLQRSEMFSRRAGMLAGRSGQQYVAALTMVWEGIAAFLTGQWKKASVLCERAALTFREHCTGVTWELNMAHNFFLGGLVAQGELRQVSRHLPVLLEAARQRGNFYLELELNTRMILVWLAADDPDGAERRGNDGISRWSQRGFQRQHYSHLLMRVQIALYRGRAGEAWRMIDGCQRQLRRAGFLRVQHTRIEAANYHARSALAVAASGEDRQRMIRIASRHVTRLEGENQLWASALARLLRAIIANLEGDRETAVRDLDGAADVFSAADMHLYASVCRRRLGSLVGGDRGRELCLKAEQWMVSQEIRNPDAMTRLIAPGLPD
jgi:hypothetical protein